MNTKALLRTSLILILFVLTVSKKSHSLPVETEYPGTLVFQGYFDDRSWGPFNIGFNFSFFCNNYSQFYVTSNGLVMFGEGSTVYTNVDIPNTQKPNNYIAPFWDDLIIHATGAIHYSTVGTAPNRKLIVQYTNMAFWNSPVLLGTFQVILYEGSNKIQTQYRSIIDLTNPRASGNSATIGLENSNGTAGVKYSFNQEGVVQSEKAIAYSTNGCSYTFDDNALYDGVLLTEPTPRAGITKLLSPANNSITSFEVNFKWEAAPNAANYNVIISTNADLSSPIHTSANLTDLNYLYTLSPDQTYYWSVNALNSNNLVTWTEIWRFTTSTNPPLVAVPQEIFLEQNDERTVALLFTGGDAGNKTATITSLPAQGSLFQYNNTPITTVPANLTDASFRFIYKATGGTGNGAGNFNFRFSDASGTSDQATFTVNVSPPGIPNFLYASKQTDRVEITFDRAMANPTGKHLEFAIRDNGTLVAPLSAALKSGDAATIILYSSSALNVDNTIEVAYTKGTVTAQSGGVLESFTFQLAGKIAQVISFDEIPAKTYGDAPFTISATASSGLPVTFTSSNSTVAGVSGNTVTINNVGSCLITAHQAGNSEYHPVTFQRLLVVDKATANITISNTTQSYTGSGLSVTTTTAPAGLPVKIEYDNSVDLPFDIGTYNVDVEIIHANYQGTASASLTIVDDASPVPDLASLPTITAECSATVTTIPTATDNYAGTIQGTTTDPLTYNTQGTYTITWSYDDGNGNITTQTQSVVIADITNPTITAPANVTVNTDMGSCNATGIALGTPVAADNCTVASVTNNAPATFPIGTTTVIWTVTDGAGRTATANQTVTVVDNQNPTITAPANVTVNANPGSCHATGVTLGTPVAADNCTVASVTNNAPATFPIGVTTVIWTVTDGAGRTATANQTVTVVDNQNPTITAPANVTVNANPGSCHATGVTLGTPVAADNCTVASVTNNAPATFPIGVTTVIWTVTDGAGRTATANQTVTVVDNQNPTITAPANVTVNTDLGSCSATSVALGTPVAEDNCTVASVTNNAPATFPIGTTTVVWTVTDGAGRTATANQTVTVVDNQNPTITAPANVTVNANPGSCHATGVTLGTPVAADNCTVASVTNNAPATFPIGTTTVIWTVTDGAGRTATANQTVTVVDNQDPTITAPANITVNTDMGSCSATGVALGTPVAADNCTVASVTNNAPATFPIGVTTVVWTVTDGAGRTATANQTVTVVDNQNPTITAPANVTVNTDMGSCSATGVALGTPVAADNCTVASVTNNAPATFPIGTTTVIWTVTDGAGRTATANQTVTVVDNQNPTITAPANVTVNTDLGSCSATGVALGTPVAADNCTVASVTNNAPATFPIGVTTVVWTVTDGAGRTATANQTVTVVDNQNPTITAPANVTVNANPGSCHATGVTLGTPVAADNCTVASVTNNAPATFPIGTTTVIWTVTDGAGRTATANQTVTVVDNQNPTITAPANVTVNTDLGSCSATGVALGTPVAADNCTVASVTNNAPATFPIGATTVVWTVTDGAGRTATANQTVTVVDNQDPTITAPANITVNTDMGSCSATGVALGTPVAADNCTVASVTNNAPATFPIGVTTVVWTVTDGAGRTATANQTVTVVDNQDPTITAPANITVNADMGSCSATGVALGTPVAADNCTVASVTNNAPATFPIGITTVVWTVTDGAGRTATANQTVTVVDNQAPVALAKNITIELDENGIASITPADVDNGSNDNCSFTLSIDISEFNCSHMGVNTVILTATDDAGNSSSANAIVNVVDNMLPVVITQNISIELDDNGFASISVSDINNGSYDNCGIASMSLDVTEFDCSNVGINTVMLTVTDTDGNSASATAVVTISDLMLPVAIAQDITVALDTNGNATITASQIDNGSFDNCGIATYSIDVTSVDCSNIGTAVPVVLTVTDSNGNSSTATANITVIDNLPPVLVNPGNQIVSSAENCMGEIIDFTVLSSATDNCSTSLTITQTPAPGTSFTGSLQVTLSATDESGNTGSVSFMVFAEDDENPVALAQDITLHLNEDGTASITAADIDNGSTDNCAIAFMSIDISEFDCSHVGNPQTVTLSVTDGNGNSAQATAIVTVVDTLEPVAIAQNLTVYLDEDNQVVITAAQINAESSDNCGIASMSIDISTFDCTNLGTNTVTLTVTDLSGNFATATAQVTVLDTVAPVVITQNISLNLDNNGLATITPADINNGSSDNCAIAEMSLDINTFNCSNIGVNQVTLTVTDFSGNSASSLATVTIADNTAPVVITKNIDVYLDDTGFAQITADDINNGSYDNCSIAEISIDINSFDCENIGENQVTLSITDLSGNTATGTAIVTILDNILPQIVCVADTTIDVPEHIGTYTVTDTSFDAFASDNCSFTISNNINESSSLQGAVFNAGTTEVEWTVTDQAGNIVTCSMSITVNIITSANSILLNSIKVYPNPAKNFLNIQVPHNNEFKVSLKDLSGREMFSGTISQTNHSINVSEYAKGVYMLEISNAFGSKVFRILVD